MLQVSLEQLASVVSQLEPLQSHWEKSHGSVLLRELANCKNIEAAFSNAKETPLLHAMSAVHGYVVMLVHVCRTGQSEIRNLLIERWGQNNRYGQKLLYKLVQLYTALVWESTLLLALCTDDIIPVGCDFGKEDLDKLPKEKVSDQTSATSDSGSSGQDTTMNDFLNDNNMDIDRVLNMIDAVASTPSPTTQTPPPSLSSGETSRTRTGSKATGNSPSSSSKQYTPRRVIATPSQLKYIKSLLGASSRLGRALAELFGLLVKLCVGNRIRMRHPQNVATQYMSSASRDIARVLSYILVDGLSHDQLPPSPIPKLKQTFLICSIGFTSPMLFDEKRYAYHLMLHTFCEEGGLQAFFDMFDFALDAENAQAAILPEQKDEPERKKDTGKATDSEMASLSPQQPELIVSKEAAIKDEEHGEFPSGSGEFLDAWLMLLEKMVNPKAILEAPHVITLKSLRNKPEFDTAAYLINVHRLAFESVTKIWSYKPIRTYGPRMTESMLTIIKHIFKGESILREKYNKKMADQAAAEKQQAAAIKTLGVKLTKPGNSTSAPFETPIAAATAQENVASTSSNALNATTPSVARSGPSGPANSNANLNQAHLNQLMDMGFLLEDCRQALYYAASVEQATEYLLANAMSDTSGTAAAVAATANQGTSTVVNPITARAPSPPLFNMGKSFRFAFRDSLISKKLVS